MTQDYPTEKRANGLGIAGFICGLFALLFSFIPLCGMVPAIVLAIIGLVLAFVGLIAALSDKRTGVAFPIVAIVTCIAPVILSIVFLIAGIGLVGATAKEMQKQAEQQRTATTRATTLPTSPPGKSPPRSAS